MAQSNIEYWNGMFVLSDADDVNELLRNMRSRPLEEYAGQLVPSTVSKSQDDILAEISEKLANIEEKIQEQQSLMREFVAYSERAIKALNQNLQQRDNERQKAAEQGSRKMMEEICAALAETREANRQLSWWQKMLRDK